MVGSKIARQCHTFIHEKGFYHWTKPHQARSLADRLVFVDFIMFLASLFVHDAPPLVLLCISQARAEQADNSHNLGKVFFAGFSSLQNSFLTY